MLSRNSCTCEVLHYRCCFRMVFFDSMLLIQYDAEGNSDEQNRLALAVAVIQSAIASKLCSFIKYGPAQKIGLMCIKYTPSLYSAYLTFCISCTGSVNCIELSIVCCTSIKSFISYLNLCTKF